MADTKAKLAEKSAAAPTAAVAPATAAGVKKRKRYAKVRNYDLGNGVYRFSRTRMFHKKAIYKFIGKTTPKKVMFATLLL